MPEPGDLIGIYEIIEEMPYKDKYNHRLYKARCVKCGFENIMRLQEIKHPKQCAHTNRAGKYIDFKTKSNPEDKDLMHILNGMRTRCYNPNDRSYRWYGAKGITICDEWLESFSSFIEWAWQNGYKKGLSIDRIDSNGPYSPENCRWVTINNNAKYKSSTKIHTINGLSMTGREWADYLGVGTNMVNRYIRMYGEEETCNFIAWFLEHQEAKEKVKSHTSYYSLYKEAVS